MSWLNWLGLKRKRAQREALPASDSRPADVSKVQPEGLVYLSWLLDCGPVSDAPMSAQEEDALREIQSTLALPKIPDTMLPRASVLVPQLIALLRETTLPLNAVCDRVSRDPVLTVEVMRLANSPFYRSQGDIGNLAQAITLIGTAGLQTVIARVVLKPIIQGSTSTHLKNAEARMWNYSEILAGHTAKLAVGVGQPSLDGYLVGLLHNTGWKLTFSAVERAGFTLEIPPTAAFANAMANEAHRLFGMAGQGWNITPGFAAYASDAFSHGLAASTHALTGVLHTAKARALDEVMVPPTPAP